jgi:hypothetical protein
MMKNYLNQNLHLQRNTRAMKIFKKIIEEKCLEEFSNIYGPKHVLSFLRPNHSNFLGDIELVS